MIGYIALDRFGEDGVYKLLLQELGRPNHANMLSHLDPNDTNMAQQVIEACFRRAIYTRMDSEIDLRAMYASIGKALGVLQGITPRIHDQLLQFACGEIIQALDEIDRVQKVSDAGVSNHLSPNIREEIDQNKQKVVRFSWKYVAQRRYQCSYHSRLERITFGVTIRRMSHRGMPGFNIGSSRLRVTMTASF